VSDLRGVGKQFAMFTAVGAVGTGAHFLVLILVVERLGGGVLIGSTAGFITGAGINYFLNYHLTFSSTKRHVHALPLFLLVAGAGMLLNALVMGVTYQVFALNYLGCQVIATGLVLLWNFAANRLWTFGGQVPSRPQH
jgi:putative flippase GtrA